jgi:hypothetical protein
MPSTVEAVYILRKGRQKLTLFTADKREKSGTVTLANGRSGYILSCSLVNRSLNWSGKITFTRSVLPYWNITQDKMVNYKLFTMSEHIFLDIRKLNNSTSRSQWPNGLRHELPSHARTLGSWVRGKDSVLCAFILFLYYSDPPSKESWKLCTRSRNWKSYQGQTKGCRTPIIIIINQSTVR